MESNSKTFIKDFTSGPVLRTLLTFTLPLFLSNLLQALYNLIDMVVVGQVVGAPGLSGISVGGDVLAMLTFIAIGFADDSQVIISMYIGSGPQDRHDGQLHDSLRHFYQHTISAAARSNSLPT